MRNAAAFVFLSVPLAIVATRCVGGCGEPVAPLDASIEASKRDVSQVDAGSDAPPTACSVDGYLLDDAYDPSCGLCYARSKEKLPPPITWKACDPLTTPAGMVCQQMVEDWAPGQFGSEYLGGQIPAWSHDGTVTFLLGRMQWPMIYRVVADADGPVHQAMLETAPSTCSLGRGDLRDGRVVYRIYDSENGALSGLGGGAYVAGIDDLRPRVLTHYHPESGNEREYYVSRLGVFEVSTLGFTVNQYDWGTGQLVRQVTSVGQEDGFAIGSLWPQGDAVFWQDYSNLAFNKLRAWTPDAGPRDLIGFGADWTKGALNMGADDTWMAWSQGDGRPQSSVMFDKIRLMSGPRTTEAAAVSGTRLTTVSGYGTSPFVVGCGFAAIAATVAPDAGPFDPQNLLVFRLSDGHRWQLPSTLPRWSTPLAITCSELFATVAVQDADSGKGHYTIGRVRLDSLGVGMAPD